MAERSWTRWSGESGCVFVLVFGDRRELMNVRFKKGEERIGGGMGFRLYGPRVFWGDRRQRRLYIVSQARL